MKLGISNIAIPADAPDAFWSELRDLGVEGVEVAPTRIRPWAELDAATLRDYRGKLADLGFAIPSLQALLFGTQDVHLLRNETNFQAMVEHLKKVGEIGSELGAKVGVFGSPKNRNLGNLAPDEAWRLGRDRFRALAEAMAPTDFKLGLEPVPATYGGDFTASATDVIRMVEEVDHPNFVVHLDTGCVMLGGDDIAAAVQKTGSLLGHFHIAEPELQSFANPVAHHQAAARALKTSGYDGWAVIEMKEIVPNWAGAVFDAAQFAATHYAISGKSDHY